MFDSTLSATATGGGIEAALERPTTYHTVSIDGLDVFYREAGDRGAPAVVLLHGFPSSSHMFRDLIPRLSGSFHVIAPDYIGFGYSARPAPDRFKYTFDQLTSIVERLLFGTLKLERFALYMQDYGAPVGFRIASRQTDAVQALVIQNANAYLEGISDAFAAFGPFWAGRTAETEQPIRALLTAETTRFQYTHGAAAPERISPDAYTFDQRVLDLPGSDLIQLELLHDYQSNPPHYPEWQAYLRDRKPRTLIVWGKNDPFFTVAGARAYLRDLPDAELHLLDGGHFVLEDHVEVVSGLIRRFLSAQHAR